MWGGRIGGFDYVRSAVRLSPVCFKACHHPQRNATLLTSLVPFLAPDSPRFPRVCPSWVCPISGIPRVTCSLSRACSSALSVTFSGSVRAAARGTAFHSSWLPEPWHRTNRPRCSALHPSAAVMFEASILKHFETPEVAENSPASSRASSPPAPATASYVERPRYLK